MSSDFPYRSRAVRAMVLLHAEHLRRFLQTWRLARAVPVTLPQTADPNYASLDTLGQHVLRAAGGYLIWICENLKLPGPGVRPAPDAAVIALEADDYLEHVLDRWQGDSLRQIGEDRLDTPEYPTRWGTRYSIDSMLEHAVMHPIRHSFQLEELMKNR